MDSAFFGGPAVRAALAGGAEVSVTSRLTATTKAAIATIVDDAWTTIEYRDWPWESAWAQLFTLGCGPPRATART